MSAFSVMARQERRAALAEPALWIALAVFALLSAYAMLSGVQWSQTRAAEAQLASAQSAERNAGFRKDLAIYESGQGSTLVKPSWYAAWIKAPTTPDARIAM
ncbi:MAG: hypothetical protein H7Z19_10740, partial [Chitinophagaceae bacterium]|nr:hypothetical protein [Rubrivivax sp.]